MTTLRQAAMQALEALQNCADGEDDVLLTRDALTALRTALAQQEQEPVVNQFNRGIEAAQQRLMQMHRIAAERHNLYHHAALELAKLKEQP